MADKVHISAQEGFKKGSYYDQYRPSYADGLVKHVSESLYREPSEEVKYHILELGAGTGKFTKKILDTLDKGYSYLATDPSESFLSVLQDTVPEIETAVCAANHIPLPDNSVQNIICATCFHWFASEKSLAEMTRVLVPEGRVILVWNIKKRVDWVKETDALLACYYEDTPRVITKQWQKIIEGFQYLTKVDHAILPGVSNMKGSKDFMIDHFSSFSVIARLAVSERENICANLRAILDKYFKSDAEIHIAYESEFYCSKKSI